MLNDVEIRMRILLSYYKAERNGIPIGDLKNNEELGQIDSTDYRFNYGWLVNHELLRGEVLRTRNGKEIYVPTGGITGKGQDDVESFLNRCAKDVQQARSLGPISGYVDKITELFRLLATDPSLLESVLELLSSVLQHVGA